MFKIISLIKGLTSIIDVVKNILEWWKDREIRKVEKAVDMRNRATAKLTEKIKVEAKKEVPNDETIRNLHRRLNNIITSK